MTSTDCVSAILAKLFLRRLALKVGRIEATDLPKSGIEDAKYLVTLGMFEYQQGASKKVGKYFKSNFQGKYGHEDNVEKRLPQ